MLSVGLLFLMFFLAFEGAVVQADDEDYDPCKAGKIFYLRFVVNSLFLRFFSLSNEPSFLVRETRVSACALDRSYQFSCQINSRN